MPYSRLSAVRSINIAQNALTILSTEDFNCIVEKSTRDQPAIHSQGYAHFSLTFSVGIRIPLMEVWRLWWKFKIFYFIIYSYLTFSGCSLFFLFIWRTSIEHISNMFELRMMILLRWMLFPSTNFIIQFLTHILCLIYLELTFKGKVRRKKWLICRIEFGRNVSFSTKVLLSSTISSIVSR